MDLKTKTVNRMPMAATENAEYSRFIQIDEDGYFKMDELRVADAEAGRAWMQSLRLDERARPFVLIHGEKVLVEAFDEPYLAVDVSISENKEHLQITMPYGHKEEVPLSSLTLDEWDRFHGRTEKGVPFVFSRAAQVRFFELLDEFDDESITVEGKRFTTGPWLTDNPDANNNAWWTNIYRTEEPRWDLGAPSHVLPKIVPRLKLQRLRVLVPGGGSGNDASWFAQQGHIVTMVDFSEEAVARANAKYGHIAGFKAIQANVFDLPSSMNSSFDLVFEHTLYCAITPSRRNELVKVWKRVLTDQGHLMGVFFTMDKPFGPPYGGSEWEIRSRLGKDFRALYWTRLRDSRSNRLGTELFVYAQKLKAF